MNVDSNGILATATARSRRQRAVKSLTINVDRWIRFNELRPTKRCTTADMVWPDHAVFGDNS